jgi:hypothetical protein
MTSEEKAVLVECQRREDEIAAQPNSPKHRTWDRRALDELREYGPEFSSNLWFGNEGDPVPERFRSRFLRAVWKLAADGLLVPTRTGARLSHLKLTEQGRQAVAAMDTATDAPQDGRADE